MKQLPIPFYPAVKVFRFEEQHLLASCLQIKISHFFKLLIIT